MNRDGSHESECFAEKMRFFEKGQFDTLFSTIVKDFFSEVIWHKFLWRKFLHCWAQISRLPNTNMQADIWDIANPNSPEILCFMHLYASAATNPIIVLQVHALEGEGDGVPASRRQLPGLQYVTV